MGLAHGVKTVLAFGYLLAEYMESLMEEMKTKDKNYFFVIKTSEKSFEKCDPHFIKAIAKSKERWTFSTWMNTAFLFAVAKKSDNTIVLYNDGWGRIKMNGK